MDFEQDFEHICSDFEHICSDFEQDFEQYICSKTDFEQDFEHKNKLCSDIIPTSDVGFSKPKAH